MKLLFGAVILITIFSVNGRYIVYEENMPDFHKKTIYFEEQMAYVFLSKESLYFTEEEKKYGHSLIPLKIYKKDVGREIFFTSKNDIRKDMRFKIITSFWQKSYGLLTFNQDNYRFVVLEDENGSMSTIFWPRLNSLDFSWEQ